MQVFTFFVKARKRTLSERACVLFYKYIIEYSNVNATFKRTHEPCSR